MKVDFHTHSDFSIDSQSPLEEMVKEAIRMGITDMAVTDHVDYDYDEDGVTSDWDFSLEDYFEKIREINEIYGDKIKLYRGVELGIQPHLGDRCNQLVAENAFDFVLASLHTVDRKDLYNQKYFKTRTAEEAIREYYKSYYDSIIQLNDFSVLGHLDLYLRYWSPLKDEPVQKYFDQIEPLLKYVIDRERGIEVNSGGYFKYKLNANNPSDDILKLYKSLKGEVITLGSDAHKPDQLGTLHQENLQKLQGLGFKYVCTFEQMKPVYHAIDKLL